MKVLCLLLALIVLTHGIEDMRLKKLVKHVRKLRERKGRQWKAEKVEENTRYDYNSTTMRPLRFRTFENPDLRATETWLTFYYRFGGFGQLRFSSKGWGVELYGCTDNKLYDGNNVMIGVPDSDKKMWSVHWDADRFYLDCNGKNVWTYEFNVSDFPDKDCRGKYTESRNGHITQFQFDGLDGETNVPDRFYVKKRN